MILYLFQYVERKVIIVMLLQEGDSDGKYGASAMKLDGRGLKANKFLFYFDDEFLALWCNIKNGKSDVYTTLN